MARVSTRRTTLVVASALAALVVVLVAALVLRSMTSTTPEATPTPTPSPSATGPTSLTATEIYNTVLPSVVVIRTDREDAEAEDGEAHGIGTGVIINAEGMVLTAAHVVADAPTVELQFADGTTSGATILSADPATDIATLLPDQLPELVVPAVLGGGIDVGSRVVAVGNPLGLIATTTEGVVSGLNRSITTADGVTLEGLIQFDAAVNPGSSGGPLLNDRAQVVGVVSSLADPSKNGYFIGIGFAVPIGAALGTTGEGEGPER